MGNANTHERRKSGVPETGLTIEDIRAPSVSLYQPEEVGGEPAEHGGMEGAAIVAAAYAAQRVPFERPDLVGRRCILRRWAPCS